jgi:CRP-like cAMP-binding protein
MPTALDVADVDIPSSSEIHGLLRESPDIDALFFRDGEYLVRENDGTKDIFIVLHGSYVVEQSREGSEGGRSAETLAVVMNNMDAPSFVGEMAYLGEGVRTASVRSSGATYALRLKPGHLETIIERLPGLTRILCRQFTARLRETTQMVKEGRKRMSMNAELLTKKAGELVFQGGEQAKTLYQLVHGTLLHEESHKILTAEQLPGGFIDPGPFFLGTTYPSTVRTETVACLVAISEDSKLAVIRNFPELMLRLYGERVD